MGLFAGRNIGCRTALATHAVRLLRADLLHGRGRAGGLAFLDWLEFAMRISAQEHAATLVELLGVCRTGQKQNGGQTGQQSKSRRHRRVANTHDKTPSKLTLPRASSRIERAPAASVPVHMSANLRDPAREFDARARLFNSVFAVAPVDSREKLSDRQSCLGPRPLPRGHYRGRLSRAKRHTRSVGTDEQRMPTWTGRFELSALPADR